MWSIRNFCLFSLALISPRLHLYSLCAKLSRRARENEKNAHARSPRVYTCFWQFVAKVLYTYNSGKKLCVCVIAGVSACAQKDGNSCVKCCWPLPCSLSLSGLFLLHTQARCWATHIIFQITFVWTRRKKRNPGALCSLSFQNHAIHTMHWYQNSKFQRNAAASPKLTRGHIYPPYAPAE